MTPPFSVKTHFLVVRTKYAMEEMTLQEEKRTLSACERGILPDRPRGIPWSAITSCAQWLSR